jgi:uncharacterized protein
MYGLRVREIVGRLTGEPFLSRLAHADVDAFAIPADPPDLVGYIGLALRGGFPDAALDLSPDWWRRPWTWTSEQCFATGICSGG